MILPNGTTVAVIDGKKLRLFRNNGTESRIQLVEETIAGTQPANRRSGTRSRNNPVEPNGLQRKNDDFVARASAYLDRLIRHRKIISLFIVTDPRTLGELHRHFHDATRETLIGELLGRDFTSSSVSSIEAALTRA
ncbi:MAG: host attachment protein [Mesorhizobium sp.]